MNGYLSHIVTIHTTPKELRKIANKMEETWPTLRPGMSTVVAERLIGESVRVEFVIDQDRMTKDLRR